MDRTSAIYIARDDALAASADEGEPYFEVFQAIQKRGRSRLDAALADLVADRAATFAALTPREQAAVAWVEAVISSGKPQAADGTFAALRQHFDDAAIAKLTALAGTMSARAKLGVARSQ